MKDKILEILIDKIKATPHDYYPTGIEGLPQSAREIADMVQKFVEWLMLTDNDFYPQIDDNGKPCYWEYNESKVVSFDYVFDYWFNNIKSTDK